MRYILFITLFSLLQLSNAQDTIFINNKGFEGEPRMGRSKYSDPPGWTSVNSRPNNSGVDIHSADSRFWDVEHEPYEGNTYLGMVAREDGSYEMLSQVLKSPLQTDAIYQFSIHLAMSKNIIVKQGIAMTNLGHLSNQFVFNYGVLIKSIKKKNSCQLLNQQ